MDIINLLNSNNTDNIIKGIRSLNIIIPKLDNNTIINQLYELFIDNVIVNDNRVITIFFNEIINLDILIYNPILIDSNLKLIDNILIIDNTNINSLLSILIDKLIHKFSFKYFKDFLYNLSISDIFNKRIFCINIIKTYTNNNNNILFNNNDNELILSILTNLLNYDIKVKIKILQLLHINITYFINYQYFLLNTLKYIKNINHILLNSILIEIYIKLIKYNKDYKDNYRFIVDNISLNSNTNILSSIVFIDNIDIFSNYFTNSELESIINKFIYNNEEDIMIHLIKKLDIIINITNINYLQSKISKFILKISKDNNINIKNSLCQNINKILYSIYNKDKTLLIDNFICLLYEYFEYAIDNENILFFNDLDSFINLIGYDIIKEGIYEYINKFFKLSCNNYSILSFINFIFNVLLQNIDNKILLDILLKFTTHNFKNIRLIVYDNIVKLSNIKHINYFNIILSNLLIDNCNHFQLLNALEIIDIILSNGLDKYKIYGEEINYYYYLELFLNNPNNMIRLKTINIYYKLFNLKIIDNINNIDISCINNNIEGNILI